MSIVRKNKTLGVIGAGVMGRTLIRGLLDSGLIDRKRIWASAKTQATCETVSKELGIPVEMQFAERVPAADLILLCVKPSQIGKVVGALPAAGLRKDTLLVSILAGVSTVQLETVLGTENPWIRAMPNTPCVVREGMTVLCGGKFAEAAHFARAEKVFQAVGRCAVVDEGHFNAITALSGSGPAYLYLVMESLADAGVRVGLPRTLALSLVSQTMLGAARMVQSTGRHPASLRDDVTTPAGCTIAGLLMLEDGKIRSVLARAIEEATKTAAGLGGGVGRG